MNRIGRKNSSRQVFWVILAASGMYITLTYRLGGISYEDTMYAVGNLMFFQFDQISPNIRALIFDLLFIGVGGMVFWLAFFGQFVLPVQSLQERGEAVLRLLALLGNDRGPALFIRDGDVIEAADKKGRSAPGVIILDTASAAVLHNKSSYTRAVGPGLVFTGRGESTAGTLDLHTQVRGLGPKDGTENPFAERLKNEKEDDFKARQERRLQTSGLTRDGVEVIPNITAVFRHQSTPGQGNTQFGYNHNAVWRAIAFEAINPDAPSDAESRRVAWDWLPVHMAADLWREYLRKFTLNELFEFTKGQEG
ncbi:MAG: hypothetical protein OEZ02_15130, partial [Anaerolineae bacterium]|nr:hypothetical protein [Anaerolineae bacterium]